MTVDTVVQARIDSDTKERAAEALEAMGFSLSVSDAIRLLMRRIADEKRFPFDVGVPNATTQKLMRGLGSGRGKHFDDADALFQESGHLN